MLDRFALWRRLHEHGAFALSVFTFQSSITKETQTGRLSQSPRVPWGLKNQVSAEFLSFDF